MLFISVLGQETRRAIFSPHNSAVNGCEKQPTSGYASMLAEPPFQSCPATTGRDRNISGPLQEALLEERGKVEAQLAEELAADAGADSAPSSKGGLREAAADPLDAFMSGVTVELEQSKASLIKGESDWIPNPGS